MSKFYLAHNAHVVEVYGDEAHELTCCGTELKELTPNTVDAAHEKHVPVATYDAAKNEVHVSVGSDDGCASHRLGSACHQAR